MSQTISDDELTKAYYSCFMGSDAGHIVLQDLRNRFFEATFTGPVSVHNHIDPVAIAINVGLRETVIYILSKIEEFEIMQRT